MSTKPKGTVEMFMAIKRVALLAACVVLLNNLTPAQCCSHGDVRLVNGSVPYEGRVEFCVSGSWVTACYDYWRIYSFNTNVVCRHLGCDETRGTYYRLEAAQGIPYEVICHGYDIAGCHFNGFSCSSISATVGIRCFPQAPGPPNDVSLSGIQSDSFTLSWSAPNTSQCRYIDTYIVNCTSPSGQHYQTTVESSTLSHRVTSQLPFTTYDCCVSANNTAGEGNAMCNNVRTESVPPGPPQDVSVVNVTSTTAAIVWTSPQTTHGPLTGYIISCSLVHDPITSQAPDVTHIELTGLDPDTLYRCCVLAVNSAGTGNETCVSIHTERVPSSTVVLTQTTEEAVPLSKLPTALAAGIGSSVAMITLLLATVIISSLVVLVYAKKRRKKRSNSRDQPDNQQHVYEEMNPVEAKESDDEVKSSTDTTRYHTTQHHAVDSMTDPTPELPDRMYLTDEGFMRELNEGVCEDELPPENKVYQPLIPPRLAETVAGDANSTYQALTRENTNNWKNETESKDYEPVFFD